MSKTNETKKEIVDIQKVSQSHLDTLKTKMPFKWRVQSAKYGKATMVAYVDSRQVQDKLDEAVGASNWKDNYTLIGDNLFCGISIKVDGEWVTKWDLGVESNMEAEKGNSSDSFKRAAVKWGVGRFLYSLGIITLPTKPYGSKNKEYPTDDAGNILWSAEAINFFCNKVIESGYLDRTKQQPSTPKPKETGEPNTLPWLNKSNTSFKKVTEALKNKTATLEDVKKKFRLSKAIEKELTEL